MRASMTNAASPDAYLAALDGWQHAHATALRRLVVRAAKLDERVKWGHLVYSSNGPVCLIRAEPARVLLGFWRGQRLRDIEPALKPGGKYEMATLTLGADATIDAKVVRRLVNEAVALNTTLGDPTELGAATKPRTKTPSRKPASKPATTASVQKTAPSRRR